MVDNAKDRSYRKVKRDAKVIKTADDFLQLLDDVVAWTTTVGRPPSYSELAAYTSIECLAGELLGYLVEATKLKYIGRDVDIIDGKCVDVFNVTSKGYKLLRGEIKRETVPKYSIMGDEAQC